MYPTREEAEKILIEAFEINPGPWKNHCRSAAHCAQKIATACGDMNPDKAYVLGLLHDIGRRFGGRHMGHVYDGYNYMMELGFDEVAKICLTHSFNNHSIEGYIGNIDVTEEELAYVVEKLAAVEYDDYDRLIQLCDSLASAEGVWNIEDRMGDVKARYGYYPQDKWDANVDLMHYFEEKMGRNIYEVCEKDTYKPE